MARFALPDLQRFLQYFSRGRTKRIVIGLLAVPFLIMIVSWLALPSLIKNIAVEQVMQTTGRKLEIAGLSFSPLSLSVTASGVRLFEADQKTVAVTLKKAVINLSSASLWRGALVMDELLLEQPLFQVVRTAGGTYGRYNFSDMVERISAMPASATPFHFSLANVQVQGGKIDFDDQVIGQKFQVAALNLGLPFLSNFPTSANSFVQPLLSATINGTPFSLSGRSKPFTDSLETTFAIDIKELDLASYRGYIPLPVPVKIDSARLSTKLDLSFSRKNNQPQLLLSGDIALNALALSDKAAQPLLKVRSLKTHIRQLNVFTTEASIEQLQIDAPEVWLTLNPRGEFNWNLPMRPVEQKSPVVTALASKAVKIDAMIPVYLLDDLQVQNGVLHFSDALYATPRQTIELRNMTFDAKQFSTAAGAKPASMVFHAEGKASQRVQFAGQFIPANGDVNGKVTVEKLDIASYQGYLSRFLAAKPSGQVSLSSSLNIQQGQLSLAGMSGKITDFLLNPEAKNEGQLAIRSLALDKLSLDVASKKIIVDGVKIAGINADIRRDAQSRLSLQKLMLSTATPSTAMLPIPPNSLILPVAASLPALPVAKLIPLSQPADWLVSVKEFAIDDSRVSFTDQAVSPAVTLKAEKIAFSATGLTSDLSEPLSLKWNSTVNRAGKLVFDGKASANLTQVALNLDAQALPVASLHPYFSSFLNVELATGNVSAKGTLGLINMPGKALVSEYDGMLRLNDFQILKRGEKNNFLSWKSVGMEGIKASFGDDQQAILIRKLALNAFFAKLVLSDKGQLNLKNILVQNSATAAAVLKKSQDAGAVPVVLKTSVPLKITISETLLQGGNIDFTDNFIRPNYQANLTGLSGKIGIISSGREEPAAVELSGKIDGDAPLLISGTVNPFSTPIFIDIKGSANGIELTSLSQYSAKYAGYHITKGHLSAQVAYRLKDGHLEADNNVRLDQLTFGRKVNSPDAFDLPVNLALALLRDNDGLVTLDLPIAGSLSDPQFSVGSIFFKVLSNVIMKAVTSPFAWLGEAFGGGEELAFAEFSPGSAVLSVAATEKLDRLITALQQRAGLRLDITGRTDTLTDTEGLRLASLDAKIKTVMIREIQKKNPAFRGENMLITHQDRNAYVQEVYRAEKFDKPRNIIGFAKTLSPEDAIQLVLSNTAIARRDLRDLADERADTVRDYLLHKGSISNERVFLIAPRLNSDGIEDKGAPNRVDFSLN